MPGDAVVLPGVTASRAVLLAAGAAALLLGGPPATAAVPRGEGGPASSPAEAEAVRLLAQAAAVAGERGFAGTQQVDTFAAGRVRSTVHAVRHEPGAGLRVQPAGGAPAVAPPAPAVDARLLPVLARRYDLAVLPGRSAGRASTVVEARRAGGAVAGRVWLDRASGLALRREVYDSAGRPVLTTAFTRVDVSGPAGAPAPVAAADGPALREQASSAPWPSPEELPGGFVRVPAAAADHAGPGVQHLAWSDGLSTVSVFTQPGRLDEPRDRGFVPRDVDGSTVWMSHEGPQRLVWNGAGLVFTLVSDAGPEDLLAVVRALPHDPDPDTGLRARLARGLARIGSWLDPTG